MLKNYFLLLFLISTSVNAQMFSVTGGSESPQTLSSSYFRIGYSPVEFNFKGDANLVQPENRLDFESPAFFLGFENPALNASFSFINKLTGADDERYLNLSLEYINRFAFIRSNRIQIGAPVQVKTNLVSVRNEQQNNDFSQNVLGFGVGAFANLRIPEKISLAFEGVPSIGFSNSSGGLFGGTNKSFVGKARLNFLNILPNRALSIGYDFNFSSYDIDNDEFDYDLISHLITVGIAF